MKLIELGTTRNAKNKGSFAMVDDEDYEHLMRWRWQVKKRKNTPTYAARGEYDNISGKTKTILMHRVIMNLNEKKLFVDHKDKNGLNNLKSNLRVATRSQNGANRKSYGSSKHLGVHIRRLVYKKIDGSETIKIKWVSSLMCNGKYVFHKHFNTEKEAALAYNEAAIKYHGEFANLNIID